MKSGEGVGWMKDGMVSEARTFALAVEPDDYRALGGFDYESGGFNGMRVVPARRPGHRKTTLPVAPPRQARNCVR